MESDLFICEKCKEHCCMLTIQNNLALCPSCLNLENETKIPEEVSHPAHYTFAGMECKDVLVARFGKEIFLANALEYIWRCGRKGDPEIDIRKAIQNLEFYLKEIKHER